MNGSGTTGRLARLDGLRGLAASGVLFYHLANWPALPVTLGWAAGWIFRSGWTLVDLFFVLSGYVFSHVYGVPGKLRETGAVAGFWTARIARLWPLHLTALALFALFAWGGRNNAPHLAMHAFMLQGFDPVAVLSFNAVSWSLTIEMLCYTVFCLAAWLDDRVLRYTAVLAVTGGGWWLALLGHPGGPWFQDIIPRGLLGFFMGHLLWRTRAQTARLPWPLLVGAMALGLRLDDGTISPLVPLGLLTWPAALLLALRLPLLESRAMLWLGERSFGIYMLHMLAIQAIDTLLPPRALGWSAFIAAQAGIVILTLIAAEGAYRWVEMPGRRQVRGALQRWYQRWRGAPLGRAPLPSQ